MEEIAQVYARSLFEVAQDAGQARRGARAARRSSPTRWTADQRAAGLLLLAVLLDEEKKDGLREGDHGRRRARHELPRAAGREPPDAGHASASGASTTACGTTEHQLLPVQITSAVELDEQVVRQIGDRIGEQTGRKVELSSQVDPDILGGIVRPRGQHDARRLDPPPPRATSQAGRAAQPRLRRHAPMQIKPDEITSILKSRIEGLDDRHGRPRRGRHRPLRGRRHRARPRPRELPCRSRCSSSRTT